MNEKMKAQLQDNYLKTLRDSLKVKMIDVAKELASGIYQDNKIANNPKRLRNKWVNLIKDIEKIHPCNKNGNRALKIAKFRIYVHACILASLKNNTLSLAELIEKIPYEEVCDDGIDLFPVEMTLVNLEDEKSITVSLWQFINGLLSFLPPKNYDYQNQSCGFVNYRSKERDTEYEEAARSFFELYLRKQYFEAEIINMLLYREDKYSFKDLYMDIARKFFREKVDKGTEYVYSNAFTLSNVKHLQDVTDTNNDKKVIQYTELNDRANAFMCLTLLQRNIDWMNDLNSSLQSRSLYRIASINVALRKTILQFPFIKQLIKQENTNE